MLTTYFQKRYKIALQQDFKCFYDDFHEYGNPETAKYILYFIPGINGVPGQIRFAFPALNKALGVNSYYIKCLYLPEFSANIPMWEKYSLTNIEKKRDQIIADLNQLTQRYERVIAVTSSNGFYDLLYAYPGLQTPQNLSAVFWVACAPDQFQTTRWTDFFYQLNGFNHNDHPWFAFPNHNALKYFNPETNITYKWRYQDNKRVFHKNDLESRFRCLNTYWSYSSISCFNACLTHILDNTSVTIPNKTYVLAATNDGFWQGKPQQVITDTINRYSTNNHILYKPTSHLWIVVPNYLTELLTLAREQL